MVSEFAATVTISSGFVLRMTQAVYAKRYQNENLTLLNEKKAMNIARDVIPYSKVWNVPTNWKQWKRSVGEVGAGAEARG